MLQLPNPKDIPDARIAAVIEHLSQDDLNIIVRLGAISAFFVSAFHKTGELKEHPDHPIPLALDWAVAHHCEPLDLRSLLDAGPLTFQSELIRMLKRINRPLAILNPGDTLAFAQSARKQLIGN